MRKVTIQSRVLKGVNVALTKISELTRKRSVVSRRAFIATLSDEPAGRNSPA
jgi:hypothetical protein